MRDVSFEELRGTRGFDPKTEPIEAELSRNDVIALHQLCIGKSVVEVGCGGSTLLLARCAATLVSYEQDMGWYELVVGELMLRDDSRCAVQMVHWANPTPPMALPRAEVYLIDAADRKAWTEAVLSTGVAEHSVVIHDSRRQTTMDEVMLALQWPLGKSVKSLDCHFMDSNLMVITPRMVPVEYENWNHTEKEGRLPHLHQRC